MILGVNNSEHQLESSSLFGNSNFGWVLGVGLVAFVVIGGITIAYVRSQRKGKEQKIENTQGESEPRPQPIPVDLCLIVPAGVVSHRKVHQTLTGEDICDIIDNAAFFHCIQSKKDSFPPEQEWKLQLTRDPILPNSERDVYIRIHIEDGGGMVGKGHPYGLKKNLPQTGVGVIEELKRLANLSGREHFYRT